MSKKIDVKMVIVYGGESAEHDISIITAITIFKKFKVHNIDVELVYQNRDGKWFVGENLSDFRSYKNFDETKFIEVTFVQGDNVLYKKRRTKVNSLFKVDFVVNCFHGGAGEDGKFSALMEQAKIPTSSSSSLTLGISMNKYLTKLCAIALDLPIVDFFNFSADEWLNARERVMQQLVQFDFPVVVKPVCQGSSIGVSFVSSIAEFTKAVNLALRFDDGVIVERAIVQKREFNCCVVRTLEGKLIYGVDEPVSNKVVITFKDKYLNSNCKGKKAGIKNSMFGNMENQKREKGAGLSMRDVAKIKKISRVLYENLDMNGVVRFDYIYDTKKEKFYLGEINAIPGSLGYYFFDDVNLLELLYNAGKNYWNKKFENRTIGAPTIF